MGLLGFDLRESDVIEGMRHPAIEESGPPSAQRVTPLGGTVAVPKGDQEAQAASLRTTI